MWCEELAKFPNAPAEPVQHGFRRRRGALPVAYQNTRALMNNVREGVYMPPPVLNVA
ncbi:hypothetical protein SAMN06296058_0149 [Pseudoxanthomonas indica]|uniref:Uncharacterized protein n=1 Tax=Pseudoxanthomonas indica TaxID=428993 RepID=A0A1T5IQ10_9GAMM|nr:hypothetical protein GCM10007235_27320 [Pseudoxanthomonas indica]SKC41274.1 hypothetical protein SAMN06296058_0149 [Pseudoxanthomonas indica]